jgi:hypothetical protein
MRKKPTVQKEFIFDTLVDANKQARIGLYNIGTSVFLVIATNTCKSVNK